MHPCHRQNPPLFSGSRGGLKHGSCLVWFERLELLVYLRKVSINIYICLYIHIYIFFVSNIVDSCFMILFIRVVFLKKALDT